MVQRTFYVVGANMPGYIPDSDPYIVRTKRTAVSASYEDARRHVTDERDAGYGARLTGRAGHYYVEPEAGATMHYWYSPVLADLEPAPAHCRCASCEMSIAPGELCWTGDGWYIHSCC